MAVTTVPEALIYVMVITSASDRDMTDDELSRIGHVVQSWPIFQDFDANRIVDVARNCQKLLHEEAGLAGALALIASVLPQRFIDTAYAAAVEVATVDLEIRMEEHRILERLQETLKLDAATAEAIERATKARLRTLT